MNLKRGAGALLDAAKDNSDDGDLNDPENDWSSAEDRLMKGDYWQKNLSPRAARRAPTVSWLPAADHCLRGRALALQLAGNGMQIGMLSPHSALQAEGARSQQSPFGMRRPR